MAGCHVPHYWLGRAGVGGETLVDAIALVGGFEATEISRTCMTTFNLPIESAETGSTRILPSFPPSSWLSLHGMSNLPSNKKRQPSRPLCERGPGTAEFLRRPKALKEQ